MAVASYQSIVKVGSTVINDIKTFDLPFKIAALDTTSFSSATTGTETYIGGLLGMQAKLSGQYNKADSGASTLEANFFARTLTALTWSPNGTNTYAFTGLITDYNVKGDVKGLVTVDFTFQLNGTVTLA